MSRCDGRLPWIAGGSALLAALATAGAFYLAGWLVPPHSGKQAMVHEMGHEVMPFALRRTRHVFEMTDDGGVQEVVARDPNDGGQIELIRQHLQHEARKFSAGDFSDPMSLHGKTMPGLQELSAGASRITIDYAPLPNGARIRFATSDPHLVTAVHRWFGAQLSDHGADATYR